MIAKNPLQLITSCLKSLKNRGYYDLPYRNSWERIEFTSNKPKEEQEDVAAIAAAAIALHLVS